MDQNRQTSHGLLSRLMQRRGTSASGRSCRVSLSATGFTLGLPDPVTVSWEQVRRIESFKADLATYDEVVVRVVAEGGTPEVLVTEECEGFVEFVQEIADRYAVAPDDWLERIIHPAFAENLTVLFDSDHSAT